MKKIILLTLSICFVWGEEDYYQIGLGVGMVSYPSYIGSKSTSEIISPIPYIRYHGKKTTIGKGGIHYRFFNHERVVLDLSLGASLPADSESSTVRKGMEDLDFTLEVGPRLNYKIYKDKEHKLSFRLPLRAVFSTDIKSMDTQGFLFAPNLTYKFHKNKLRLKLKTGPIWADKHYHDYFYGVSSKDETAQRKSYDAKGGYNGYRNSISFKYNQGAWNYGGFVSHFNIDGAVFDNSPLVETKSAFFLGSFISYTFYKN